MWKRQFALLGKRANITSDFGSIQGIENKFVNTIQHILSQWFCRYEVIGEKVGTHKHILESQAFRKKNITNVSWCCCGSMRKLDGVRNRRDIICEKMGAADHVIWCGTHVNDPMRSKVCTCLLQRYLPCDSVCVCGVAEHHTRYGREISFYIVDSRCGGIILGGVEQGKEMTILLLSDGRIMVNFFLQKRWLISRGLTLNVVLVSWRETIEFIAFLLAMAWYAAMGTQGLVWVSFETSL